MKLTGHYLSPYVDRDQTRRLGRRYSHCPVLIHTDRSVGFGYRFESIDCLRRANPRAQSALSNHTANPYI